MRLVKFIRAFDPGNVADQHAVAHDLRLKTSRTVGVPLGFAAAGKGHADAELAIAATEQVSVDATVTEGVDHSPGAEFVHPRKVVVVPEESLNVRSLRHGQCDGDAAALARWPPDKVSGVTSPGAEHLDSRHKDTVRQILEHPTSHNIEWRAVMSLLDAVGTVTVRHDGKVAVKLGSELEFLEPPVGKDIDDQMVVDLRRMLTKAGYGPQ